MYQHVVVNHRAKISQQHHQLCIETDKLHQVPLEDVSTLVLAERASTITTHCLNALVENGSTVIVCGKKHQPTGIFLPFGAYSRRLCTIKLQMELPKPCKKRLWQRIVQQKIRNQGMCLTFCGKKDIVSRYADKVHSGDTGNVEAIAAAKYFPQLFGKEFVRHELDRANAVLDYGYAILRGSIARFLASYGFEPCLGLEHHSETNAFNLADDLIEPFRPIVDLYARIHLRDDEDDLSKETRSDLVGLLRADIQLGKERVSVDYAIEKVIQNLIRCYKEKQPELVLPQLLPLASHSYE